MVGTSAMRLGFWRFMFRTAARMSLTVLQIRMSGGGGDFSGGVSRSLSDVESFCARFQCRCAAPRGESLSVAYLAFARSPAERLSILRIVVLLLLLLLLTVRGVCRGLVILCGCDEALFCADVGWRSSSSAGNVCGGV